MGFVHRTWWGWGKYSLSSLWSRGTGQLCSSPAPYEPLLQILSKTIHVKTGLHAPTAHSSASQMCTRRVQQKKPFPLVKVPVSPIRPHALRMVMRVLSIPLGASCLKEELGYKEESEVNLFSSWFLQVWVWFFFNTLKTFESAVR